MRLDPLSPMEKIQFPATVFKVSTLADGSVRIVVDTRELGVDELAILFSFLKAEGWFLFAPSAFRMEELNLPEITEDTVKITPSQRLRNCLYRLWEKNGKKGDFNTYYLVQMSKLIEFVKEKLG